jgi:hypothetical protein
MIIDHPREAVVCENVRHAARHSSEVILQIVITLVGDGILKSVMKFRCLRLSKTSTLAFLICAKDLTLLTPDSSRHHIHYVQEAHSKEHNK